MDLLAVLRDEGVEVGEHGDWRHRGARGAFEPVGLIVHHTAAGGTSEFPSLKVVTDGRTGVPGPLCNVLLGRGTGRAKLIADEKANDSGNGSAKVLEEVKRNIAPSNNAATRGLADSINGNPYFYDIECENNGVGEGWSPQLIESLILVCTAICRAMGWPAARVIGHKEWTRRKIDPAGIDMKWLRDQVAMRLGHTPAPPTPPTPPAPPTPVPGRITVDMNLPLLQQGAQGPHVVDLQHFLNSKAGQGLRVDGDFGPGTKTAVENWQRFFRLGVDGKVGPQTWKTLVEMPL